MENLNDILTMFIYILSLPMLAVALYFRHWSENPRQVQQLGLNLSGWLAFGVLICQWETSLGEFPCSISPAELGFSFEGFFVAGSLFLSLHLIAILLRPAPLP